MSQVLDDKLKNLSPEELNLWKLRHTAEHVLTEAMINLYGEGKVIMAMGPATEDGFYFDFDSPEDFKISEADFKKIEKEMWKIINTNLPLTREEITVSDAKKLFKGNPYKQEWLKEIESRGESVSIYKTGDQFVDLCSGPHADSTGAIKAFKLLSVAGAYWHGDEKNKMLTRIYGTAFASKQELDEYLHNLEEAKKRDHRKIGQDQDLFFIDDMVGKGLIMWLPKGQIIKQQVEDLAKDMEEQSGYLRVSTPHIAKEELFLTSGHLPYYKDSMYPPMEMDDGVYYLKAMNCPHHHRIFLHKPRSYKELPLRLAEYGTCYRNELSGTLAGLLRVRGMDMNDAHIYCRKNQIKDEFKAVIKLTQNYFKIFGLKDYWFRLSKWDPSHTDKYINEPENWAYSESIIREVLEEMKVNFVEAEDEAAFYGPKVDVQFKSIIGREETMSTIQLDFVAKSRFGLSYTDANGAANDQVFVIHRAPLSVHERFMAFMIEHYAGAFPVWLSPIQAVVIPISQDQGDYANNLNQSLRDQGIRSELWSDDSMQKRIRTAEKQKIPYMLIVGQKEADTNTVSVRGRGEKDLGVMPQDQFLSRIAADIKDKTIS